MAAGAIATYDVIINGGGTVGFTLLNALLKSPHLKKTKILLIEQGPKPSHFNQPPRTVTSHIEQQRPTDVKIENENTKTFSSRVWSISPSNRQAFIRLGVWDSVSNFAHDVHKIRVWNYNYSNQITFNSTEPECDGTVFSVLENNRLNSALLRNLEQLGRLDTILWKHTMTSLQQTSDGLIRVGLKNLTENSDNNGELQACAPLVLGCDGFKSKVRQLTHTQYREIDLKKTALVGTLRMQPGSKNNRIAYQRFSANRDTIVALLPLDDEFSSCVISAPPEYAQNLMQLDSQNFVSELNQLLASIEVPTNSLERVIHQAFNWSLPKLAGLTGHSLDYADEVPDAELSVPQIDAVMNESRATFPIIFGTTSPKMVTPVRGCALLGDAAHRVHPLAGQGLNLGIQDALVLAEELERSVACGERLFNHLEPSALVETLTRFEQSRQLSLAPMQTAILAMPHLFRLSPPATLAAFNRLSCAKKSLIRYAS